MLKINIAKDFTRFPSGRFSKNGDTSGQDFRVKFLEEPVKNGEEISIELDGTIGYGSSFLEEAFGGLVRSLGMSSEQLKSQLHLESSDPMLLEEIFSYIDDAAQIKRMK